MVTDGINITVKPSRGKYLRLRINAVDAEVYLSVPRGTSASLCESFVRSKMDWIKRTRREILERTNLSLESESLALVFGRLYEVVPCGKTALSSDKLYLRLPAQCTAEEREAALGSFYRSVLKEYIGGRIEQLELEVGRRASGFSLRKMRSRWGSCNVAMGKLTFNTALAKKPKEAVDYVIVHELTHLIYPDHGREFKAHLTRCMPDWKRRKKLLNGD